MPLKAKDFNLPQGLERYRLAVREFVRTDLERWAERLEEMTHTPHELVELMAEAGLLKLTLPREYGGWELTQVQYVPILEEVAKSHGAIRMVVHGANGLSMRTILEYGTEEMKRNYLARIGTGEATIGFVLTEPGTGSGVDIKTTAVRDGDNFILNGRKHIITNADMATALNTLTVTDRSAGRRGLTSFLVEKTSPGLSIIEMPQPMGNRGTFHAEIVFKDCVVPAKNVLGEVGQGIDVALELLDLSRFSIAVSCLGLVQRFLELCVPYTRKRVTFGKPIAERQAVQQMLADMATDVYALRMMVNDVAQRYDLGLPIRKESSMCKLFGLETVRRVGDSALIIHGGLGYFKTFVIERMYRDSRALWFEEGTPTIQRLVIARDVFEEFKE